MVSRHMTTIDQKTLSSFAGVQPPASSGRGTSIGQSRHPMCLRASHTVAQRVVNLVMVLDQDMVPLQ